MTEMKSYQEIPVELFSWAVKKYKGLIHGKEWSPDRYAILKSFKDNSFLIEKRDLGYCHPSYPITIFKLYNFPEEKDKPQDDFKNIYDLDLENNLVLKIESDRVSDKYKCHHPIYNLIYGVPEIQKDSNIVKGLVKDIKEKADEMLRSGDFIVSDKYTSEDFRTKIENNSEDKRNSDFTQFVEENRFEELDFEEWFEKYPK